MLPLPLAYALPAPFAIALLCLTTWHLLPFLQLLPSLAALSSLSFIPKPRRNLPREFFNLPPRSDTSSTSLLDTSVLGIRAKVVLLLTLHAGVSLLAGWIYLILGSSSMGRVDWILVGLSITPVPSVMVTLTLFAGTTTANRIVGEGGVTHQTVFRRVLPVSMIPICVSVVLAAAVPSAAGYALVGLNGALVASVLGLSTWGLLHRSRPREGHVRLSSPLPSTEKTSRPSSPLPAETLQELQDGDSWVTSPSRASTVNLSPFSYATSGTYQTPHSTQRSTKPSSSSPTSWLSSPTNTPSTIPSWTYSPSIPSPPPTAMTKSPQPDRMPKSSTATSVTHYAAGETTYLSSTPGSALRSPGGSILAGYSPDPFHPLPPRKFESLTSYPLSPSQMADSRLSLTSRALGFKSHETIAFIPEEHPSATGSTWTLESWHSAATGQEPVTPANQKASARHMRHSAKRAPPPPPMPDMPLPPTPTVAQFNATEWSGKESTEVLLAAEREWVEVYSEGSIDEWNQTHRGAGVLAIATTLICFALAAPLCILGPSDPTQNAYLVSLILPAPALVFATYLLRYRSPKLPSSRRAGMKKGSTQSSSTHRSLALVSESQLSLPISLSPKLTPPGPTRPPVSNRYTTLLEPKPSISNFGHHAARQRPHTIIGGLGPEDAAAEARARKLLARRSGDLWIENGHAKATHGLQRVGEMLKPLPAMRVLGEQPERLSVLERLRDSVLSRFSGTAWTEGEDGYVMDVRPKQPERLSIKISSPGKTERRVSAMSMGDMGDDRSAEEIERSVGAAEIQVAQRGRMSTSPVYLLGKGDTPTSGPIGDWLVHTMAQRIVSSSSAYDADATPKAKSKRHSSMSDTPARKRPDAHNVPTSARHSRGQSTSIDWSSSPSFDEAQMSTPHGNLRQRLRHKISLSLPNISADFADDVRKSMDDCQRGSEQDANQSHAGLSTVPEVSERSADASLASHLHMTLLAADKFANMSGRSLREQTSNLSLISRSSDYVAGERFADAPDVPELDERYIVAHDYSRHLAPADEFADAFEDADEDEARAVEMEQVLHMDTPTRAEFVISPTPSTFSDSSRWSRPSTRMTRRSTDHLLSERSSSATLAAEWPLGAVVDFTAPPAPFSDSLPASLVALALPGHAAEGDTQQYTSHPHPPPHAADAGRSVRVMPSFESAASSITMTAHPPVNPRTLRAKKSTETLASTYTTDTDGTASPMPAFKPSKQELLLVQRLKERANEIGAVRQKTAPAEKRTSGLKPLRLVDRNSQLPLPALSDAGKGDDKVKVLGMSDPPASTRDAKKMSATTPGKENARGKLSKMSRGSAGTGASVIRA